MASTSTSTTDDTRSKYSGLFNKEGATNADRYTGGANKQRGIIHWGLSPNRQNVTAGMVHDAFFNTFRRTKSQIFYWLPAMLGGYYLMHWAIERYAD